jgi:hypothetical protein
MPDIETLKYPVGKMPRVATPLDRATREQHLHTLGELPAKFRSLTSGLTDAQLDTPYRPDGWTIRQVVHHVPDSHMNAYIRMKLAARWLACLRAYPESNLQRVFVHPAWGRVTVDEGIAMYAWHARHHTAHIEQALALR